MNHSPHWSDVEWLHKTVKNPNIVLKGTHTYYSSYYDKNFEDTAVRYLYGDEYSQKTWVPMWEIDKLIIGDYVQIAAGVIFLMGGNNTHNTNFISTYPFQDKASIKRSYESRGDTVIGNDVWIGMEAMIMPGVKIGNGAIIASRSVVTKDIPPYTICGGNPAKVLKARFSDEDIAILQKLEWWNWPEEKVQTLLPFIQSTDIAALVKASEDYDKV